MAIKKLDQNLINKIAAGEVVERPVSVVKELVENSLDSGAKNITIEIKNGGLNLIKVVDDGCGMAKEDVLLSVEQHATSKISNEDDLFNIQSLGFRGEALASISSVSQFELISKTKDSLAGYSIKIENLKKEINEVSAQQGTTVNVSELFFNVPVRRKYLKTAVTEFNHIVNLFLNYSLAFPKISWKLIHNGSQVYHFVQTDDLKERIQLVLGKNIAENLLEVKSNYPEIKISGYVGKPQIGRKNRKLQYLFINKRPVNEYIISKSVKDAFGTLLFRDLYPVFILNLEIDPEQVDVNVHPRKLEVRFSEPQIIYRAIYKAISSVLDESDLIKNISVGSQNFVTNNIKDNLNKNKPFSKLNLGYQEAQKSRSQGVKFVKGQQAQDFSQQFLMTEKQESLPAGRHGNKTNEQNNQKNSFGRIIGQIKNSYIIIETDAGLKIIDQHAASERVQYEKIKKQWFSDELKSQKLLLPENFDLPVVEATLLKERLDLFKKLGYELEEFGQNSFVINAVPQFLLKNDVVSAIKEILSEVKDFDLAKEVSIDNVPENLDKILKLMACKSAIKFGDPLMEIEMIALLEGLFSLTNQYTCVHGRPCVFELNWTELEKIFKRNQ